MLDMLRRYTMQLVNTVPLLIRLICVPEYIKLVEQKLPSALCFTYPILLAIKLPGHLGQGVQARDPPGCTGGDPRLVVSIPIKDSTFNLLLLINFKNWWW